MGKPCPKYTAERARPHVRGAGSGGIGDIRLHRALLQQGADPLRARQPRPRGVRGEACAGGRFGGVEGVNEIGVNSDPIQARSSDRLEGPRRRAAPSSRAWRALSRGSLLSCSCQCRLSGLLALSSWFARLPPVRLMRFRRSLEGKRIILHLQIIACVHHESLVVVADFGHCQIEPRFGESG